MREIKFRAWNKRTNAFVENSSLKRCFDEKIDCVRFEADESVVIPIQYTGLKDKKGFDIYEEDILVNPENKKGVVEFFDGSFCLKSNGYYVLNHGFLKNKTVIGNIFENSEMLLV